MRSSCFSKVPENASLDPCAVIVAQKQKSYQERKKSARRLVKEWRGPCGPNAKKDIEESKSLTRYECGEKRKYKPKVAMGPPSQELHCL